LQTDIENVRKYNESIKKVWEKEIDIFNRVININSWDYRTFVDKVSKIQSDNWLNITWIIDENTLKIIYTEFYYYERENAWFPLSEKEKAELNQKINSYLDIIITEVKTEKTQNIVEQWETNLENDSNRDEQKIKEELKLKKTEIKQEMSDYKEQNDKAIFDDSKLNFNTWKNFFSSITWKKWKIIFDNSPVLDESKKYISKWLDNMDFNDNIEQWDNKIIISNIEWTSILRFYINGDLHLATIVSPWLEEKPTEQNTYPAKHRLEMYHVSSDYPEKNEKKWIMVDWWAIMPYAVHLTWWYWIHGSDSEIDGKFHSHWCIRTPLYYAKEIYDKIDEIQSNWWKVIIDTTSIYN
jgi:hypothetical protein